MTFRTFTLADLCLSPLNVRTNTEDAEATEALEASILARGLLFPLVVHPFASFPKLKRIAGEPKHEFGTLAGGRRLRAIRKLAADGRIPADWPIDGVIRDVDPAQITELSLAENLLRRELRPYEIHAAIAKAEAQGATLEEIAANIGQRPEWVARQLRLGQLAPEIFAAYAAGKLPAESAQAYAATADHDLQRAAFTHFGGERQAAWVNPHQIRHWMKIGDFELAKLLRFVGLDAYRKAGGTFELDLFYDGPEDRGRVADEGILRQLAETRLEELREDLRAEYALPDLRFLSGTGDAALWFDPELLPDGECIPEAVLARIEIETAGKATVSWFWESKKARLSHERGNPAEARPANHASEPRTRDVPAFADDAAFEPTVKFTAHQAARAAVKDEHGLTADGLHAMRSIRREILRAVLVADAAEHGADEGGGTLGRDYLIWSQLRHEFASDRDRQTGARGLTSGWTGSDEAEPKDFVAPLLDETLAHAHWERAVAILVVEPFMTEPDPAVSLGLYVACDERLKNFCAAVLAGGSLLRSANVPGWRIAAHDKLAELAGADVATIRKAWSPTPSFMALFPKLKRLEHAAPFIDAKVLAEWAKKDDRTISGATAAALDPATHSDPAVAKAAGEWVHELLDFRDPTLLATVFSRRSAQVRELEPAL